MGTGRSLHDARDFVLVAAGFAPDHQLVIGLEIGAGCGQFVVIVSGQGAEGLWSAQLSDHIVFHEGRNHPVRAVPCSESRRQGIRGRGGHADRISEVEAQYVGFDAKRLPSVLRAIIRDLRKDHPGIGRFRIPSTLGGSPWDFGARPKVLEEMRMLPRRGCVQ